MPDQHQSPLANGNPAAVERFLRRNARAVYALARRSCADESAAATATEAVFATIWSGAAGFPEAQGDDRTHALGVARRLLRLRVTDAAAVPTLQPGSEGSVAGGLDDSEAGELARAGASLRQLPGELRRLLELVLTTLLPFPQIAATTDHAPTAARGLARRGLLQLHALLGGAAAAPAHVGADRTMDTLAELVLAEHVADEPLELIGLQATLQADHGRELCALRDTASLATAALLLADAPPLSAALQRQLEAEAAAYCVRQGAIDLHRLTTPPPPPAPPARRQSWTRLFAATGLVATAGLLLVIALQQPASPERARQALLASDAASVRAELRAGSGEATTNVRGDVVWSDARQEGYLRVAGLPALADDQQFQLWITDAARAGAPVDGGLFGAGDAGERILPVHAKLPIGHAAAFAITIERRGGVVVSARKRVVAVAGG